MIGWALLAAGLTVAVAAALVLSRLSGWLLPWLKGTLLLAMVGLGLFVMAAGWAALEWQGVSSDRPLYRLSIEAQGGESWRVELRAEESLLRERVVSGDLLEISGRLLVLEVPLGGGRPSLLYRTDSIRGYETGTREPLQFNAGRSLKASNWIDIWRWDRVLPLPLVRAESLYPLWIPLVDGAVFEVVLQGNQIVPIPANSEAEQALERLRE